MSNTQTQLVENSQSNSDNIIPVTISRTLQYERNLQLNTALQATLDLQVIIETFHTAVANLLNIESTHYAHEYDNLSILLGNKSQHSCSYQLTISNEYLGEVTFTRDNTFLEEEIEQIESLLCLLVYPVRNGLQYQRAVHSALHDPLTGLLNRASLTNTLHRDLDLAKRYKLPLSILALDLDHFKTVNDTYGHSGGDAVLKVFAQRVNDIIRDSDVLFRIGGEEFIIILGKTDMEGGILLADRIRHNIESLVCHHNEQMITGTVSIGVATYIPGDNEQNLLERADEALYRAKDEGRNKVCI